MSFARHLAGAILVACVIAGAALVLTRGSLARSVGDAAGQGPVAITVGGVRSDGPGQLTATKWVDGAFAGNLRHVVVVEAAVAAPVALLDWAARRRRRRRHSRQADRRVPPEA